MTGWQLVYENGTYSLH